MKKNLLVTLADKNYLDQAKQLFSGAYFNAGWQGDYMLLSYKIPEKDLKWFRRKGILVKKCRPLLKNIPRIKSIKLCLFYLFTPEFKKWKNIVLLGADLIIRASLEDLTKIKGLAAVPAVLIHNKLIDQFPFIFREENETLKAFNNKYNVIAPAFLSGIMAFSTDEIESDTLIKLKKLYKQYHRFSNLVDQPILNLLFHKRWIKLPLPYLLFLGHFKFINPNRIQAIILHSYDKPWLFTSHFYKEWKSNFDRAEKINLKKIPSPRKKWSSFEIKVYSLYLKIRFFLHFPNWMLMIKRYRGLTGFYFRCNFPRLYTELKKIRKNTNYEKS